MSVKTKGITFGPVEKNIIVRDEWLTDTHMDHFQRLLASCSNYKLVETWRIQLVVDTIQAVSKDTKHIQILHSASNSLDGHWVCNFYDRKNIFIYDSLNKKILHNQHKQFLEKLFPTYDFEKNPVKFPTVQRQPNNSDCGVFAIAFATSLLFNIKPNKEKYEHKLMRSQLIKILYLTNFERDRQKVVSSRKWLYNKRYYEKNPVAIKNIFNKSDIKNNVEKQLEAEKIVRRCMQIRDKYVRDMYN
ncbi:hypothetical protein ALC57_13812 [Trachymyrmex cornetzi]|uniref:Ubiquitin-like protease family profile domain-containing protein n=1 Tax=Trachymyrmex cornetzi TaxID=471704 RepID=A0A151IZ08_9HYME|nr:hypothetical protein ALC57_13812 [Trachymyrmex cornetzi]